MTIKAGCGMGNQAVVDIRLGGGCLGPRPGVGRAIGETVRNEGGTVTAGEADPRVRQLGEYIRIQRQMADMSLRGMAEMTKVSNAYLSQVERGLHLPSLRVLQAIAAALGVPAETLLAQAGLDLQASGAAETRTGTEDAIRSDPALTPEERDALVRVYRSFVAGRSAPA